MKLRVTQSAIDKLKPGDYLADTATPGLRVVANKTTRTFVYRYRDKSTGKLKQVTIGDTALLAIAEARDNVRALQQARESGESPQRVFRQPVEDAVAENIKAGYTESSN